MNIPVLNKEQQKKINALHKKLIWGSKHKKVFTYPNGLIDRLRPYHVAGLPTSILLLVTELCNGFCYDRSVLMSLAFSDAKVVHGNIETLRITTGGEEYAEHSFVVTKQFGGNHEWVVDTSIGLIYDKDFYYNLEKVVENEIISKETLMKSPMIQEILASDFEQEKYALPLYLPLIEAAVSSSNWLGTSSYRDIITSEFQKFKEAVNYDAIKAEIDEDMRMMYRDPAKLDEKFQIVRDKYGREISRGGVPNPYYVSPETVDAREAKLTSIGDNEEELKKFYSEIFNESLEIMNEEARKVAELAEIRFAEIMKNPTANFYDNQPGSNG